MRPIIIAALLAAGCASAPPPRPVALDPSNPAAAEAPRPVIEPLPVSEPLSKETTPPSGAHDHGAPKPPAKPAHQHEHGGAP